MQVDAEALEWGVEIELDQEEGAKVKPLLSWNAGGHGRQAGEGPSNGLTDESMSLLVSSWSS
jgi:hypothetical protein